MSWVEIRVVGVKRHLSSLVSLLLLLLTGFVIYDTAGNVGDRFRALGIYVSILGTFLVVSGDLSRYRREFSFLYNEKPLHHCIRTVREKGEVGPEHEGFGKLCQMLESSSGFDRRGWEVARIEVVDTYECGQPKRLRVASRDEETEAHPAVVGSSREETLVLARNDLRRVPHRYIRDLYIGYGARTLLFGFVLQIAPVLYL